MKQFHRDVDSLEEDLVFTEITKSDNILFYVCLNTAACGLWEVYHHRIKCNHSHLHLDV